MYDLMSLVNGARNLGTGTLSTTYVHAEHHAVLDNKFI